MSVSGTQRYAICSHLDDLRAKIWQVYKGDSFHLMPVITPAYPEMCATFNITKSTKAIIQRELDRGAMLTDKIQGNQLQWKDMFTKHTFFTKDHKYYLAIIASSTTKEAHQIWYGFVESKVRILVGDVERHGSIAVARPFTKGVDRKHKVKNAEETERVQNGNLDYLIKDDMDEDLNDNAESSGDAKNGNGASEAADVKDKADTVPEEEKSFLHDIPEQGARIYTTTFYLGLELAEGKSRRWCHCKNLLPLCITACCPTMV
jgi:poly(A) polymerase